MKTTILLESTDDIFKRAENLMNLARLSFTNERGGNIRNDIARGLHIYNILDKKALDNHDS